MKAKRIVSFCSLFSLVLILSVYYVLSPVTLTNNETVNSEINNDEVVEVLDGETAYFENLEVLKETAFLEEIKQLEAVLASASSSSTEKIEALEVKSEKTKMNAKEKELATLIKEKGYTNVYVEFEGAKLNVLVSKQDASKSDALDIIRTVYRSVDLKYTPSVMFKA